MRRLAAIGAAAVLAALSPAAAVPAAAGTHASSRMPLTCFIESGQQGARVMWACTPLGNTEGAGYLDYFGVSEPQAFKAHLHAPGATEVSAEWAAGGNEAVGPYCGGVPVQTIPPNPVPSESGTSAERTFIIPAVTPGAGGGKDCIVYLTWKFIDSSKAHPTAYIKPVSGAS